MQEVSEITRQLKMLAKDLMIPVICCAQLARSTEGRGRAIKPDYPTCETPAPLSRTRIL